MDTAVRLVKIRGADISIWLHTDKDPSDAEWEVGYTMHLDIGRQDPQRLLALRTLIISDGGAPSAQQRARLFGLFSAPFASSLITTSLDNPLKRAIANTIAGFLNPKFRMHAPSQTRPAFQHVDLLLDHQLILRHFEEMQRELAPVETLALVKQALSR